VPLALGAGAAWVLLEFSDPAQWIGPNGQTWQFIAGVGMACAVTALPILVLFLQKLEILRSPMGQRILRYASLDDIMIWAVLALILLDWERVGRQAAFLVGFAVAVVLVRKLIAAIPPRDRWYVALVWLAGCGYLADWSGLHYMVGAFLAGAALDAKWFGIEAIDKFRDVVLLAFMPVFFLSTGLRTNWDMGGTAAFAAAALLLTAMIVGKLAGVSLAGKAARLGQGRGLGNRLAAADQGADHDHLRQRAARQGHHHQRRLHRAAAGGRGIDHADDPGGNACLKKLEGLKAKAG
jgi:Kef-type K+ transport system membrane component KefB